jgi:hypothetical protein
MHDPMTVAFEIRYPWKKYGKRGRTEFERNYREPFITVWHVDPEKDGSDDSCDWFGRRMTDREKAWAKSLIENEYGNVRSFFSTWIKLNHGEGKCDDPEDCYCGEHVPICKQEEMVTRVLQIASCYKREFRRFRWHPRWHFWHWKVQVLPVLAFKRWAFSRCAKCSGRFGWGEAPVSGSWYSDGPRWFRSEKNIWHMSCDRAVPQEAASCGVRAE